MKVIPTLFGLQLIGAIIALCLHPASVSAQSITPADDGTNTQINTDGNRYDIEGGSSSNDGQNLFHSFEKFGLENGETANFISNPDIVNILGRVVGGDASIINGLIQITGGSSNLFLINPAGVIFGANATLNIPANLTVTTATGILFGQNEFSVVGDNNYSTLIGTPSGYNFAVSQPGVILNEGNLALSEGSNLTLLGGTVINTGQLSSPGGQITIAAVEGENFVRISQEGQLLNLEITPLEPSETDYPITPLSLPELLTGGESDSNANTVIISDGRVILQNSDTIIPEEAGTTIAAGFFDVSAENIGGTVNLFSSNFAIIESIINTTGQNFAGNIVINSDNNITVNQLTAATEATQITAAADINFNQMTTPGFLAVTTTDGNINSIGENSLITAPAALFKTGETGNIGTVDNPLLLSIGAIEAASGSGGIFLGNNGDLNIGNISEDFTALSTTGGGNINLNVAGNLAVAEELSTTGGGNININVDGNLAVSETISTAVNDNTNAGNVTITAVGNVATNAIEAASFGGGNGGNINIESTSGQIGTDVLLSVSPQGNAGNVTLTAENGIGTFAIFSDSQVVGNGGNITLNTNSGEINTGPLSSTSVEGDGGNISLTADGNMRIFEISSNSQVEGLGGNITLNSNSGQIEIAKLNSTSVEGDAGNVNLTANGNIFIDELFSNSQGEGLGGDITLNSNSGQIEITTLNSTSVEGDAGNVNVTANQNISINELFSNSQGEGLGGDVTFNSNSGQINVSTLDSSSSLGDGGNVSVTASEDILISELFSNSEGEGLGGDVTLNSDSGPTNVRTLNSTSVEGNGGNVSVTASEDILINELFSNSEGEGLGGDITLNSNSGQINIRTLSSTSVEGNGGNISIEAFNDIAITDLDASGDQNGGEINIINQVGNIFTGVIDSSGVSGTDGNVNIQANLGGIEFGEFASGNLTVTEEGEDNPFTNNNPEADLNSDANLISNQGGEVILEAHNDITLNQAIESDSISLLELRAGRNININANIDTSANNGDITLEANAEGANPEYRESGTGNIIMQPGTLLNAGEGDIQLSIGQFGEAENIGDITIANIQTTGNVTVDARDGNIISATNDSIITADSGNFETKVNGGIGSETNPINLNINTLTGEAGSSGAFFNSPNQGITINQFSSFTAGDVVVRAQGNITTEGTINTSNTNGSGAGNITLESTNGEINTIGGGLISSSTNAGNSENIENAGNVTLTADGNITTGIINTAATSANGGEISIESINGEIDARQGFFESRSTEGNAGNIILTADGNITTNEIDSTTILGNGGDISIESISGEINTTQAQLNSSSSQSNAGDITLTANGNISTNFLQSVSDGGGEAGDIIITSRQGTIDTTANNTIETIVSANSSPEEIRDQFGWTTNQNNGEENRNGNGNLDTFSREGIGGNIILEAQGDITVADISSWGGNNSGNVEITTSQGDINTAVILSSAQTGSGGNIILNAPQGKITTAQLLSDAEQGNAAGNISLDAAGHIEIQSILSQGLQRGGDITINSDSQNSINILGDLQTFSEEGIAGNITLSAPGNITIQNVTSFGQTESGNLTINSEGNIFTESVTTQAEDGPSGNIIINGENIATGNVSSIGTDSAGIIEITATDGSVRTEDITSSSAEGDAGGIDIEATDNINTEDQTVESEEGDSTIENTAGNDINTDNQTAETNNGNASVSNTAENNINTDNQTAETNNGNSAIDNTANNINANNQTARTEEGNASINNTAENDINVNNQTATTQQGNASIENTAGNDINVNNQTAITESGDANISNTAGNDINVNNQTAITEEGTATIENNAGGEVNVDSQTAIQDGNPGTIINQEGDSNPQTEIQESNSNTIINQESISNSDNSDSTNLSNNSTQTLVTSEDESISSLPETGESDLLPGNRVNTIETDIQASSDTDGDNLSSDSDNINSLNLAAVSPLSITSANAVTRIESSRNQEFADYFGEDFASSDLTTEDVRTVLDDITQQTGTRSAIVYVTLATNQLELVVFTAENQPLFYRVEIPREQLLKVAMKFHQEVANPRMSQRYLKPAQQLYDWLIRPLETHLTDAGIDTILFSLDSGLRSLPIAAIHDGEQFLIEKYSLSLIPSVSLINTNYKTLANTEVLAMGASEFTQLEPLPNVPIELEIITQRRWLGDSFLNQEFTRDNLMNQRQNNSYSIIHLATHSDFSRQNPDESYIQLWQDEQLKASQLRTFLLVNPQLEMLVLSSCRTAVGDEKAELGFAGLAVQAGVKSALASLWYVDDTGTLGLMSEFYRHLDGSPIKADALRKAQLAMIQGTVEDIETQLIANQSLDEITSSQRANSFSNLDLSHPYYWSGFTMIGSPW
ncbi:MAG: CHAT domain-containing protein [Microcoleaceae cyanobacterium]